ncbi:MAG: tRNA uridine-5-carboxymethylaminomethyl(34) synthesis GTPase MnmE [Robiginitomaculum sp.]|nr:tRNA uridine-5-carboxymethylaminomethyl(34) synthesis GTPase MnmE [Robiginitomaculum sp.]
MKTRETIFADTIFALATAQGRAGVAVMRISGPKAGEVLCKLSGRKLPPPRMARLRVLQDTNKDRIDEALVLWFPAPASFTGEDVVEFHIHGSVAVIEAVSTALYDLGLRQADAGEFTRRAFENGKLDLTEAEGLADLIDAQSDGQRRQALRQMRGGLRDIYEGWRTQILDAFALVEGEIDFPDEGDVPDALAQKAGPGLKALAKELKGQIADSKRGERVRSGLDIAIIGAPNAGKSSILNRLARRDAAIVTPEAGTTRDIVEVHTHIAGLPVCISDTAGLRETDNVVEAEGVRRAKRRARDADLRLGVIDLSNKNNEVLTTLTAGDFVLYNKADLSNGSDLENVSRETFAISTVSGEGFDELESALEREIISRFSLTEQAGLTRTRHVDCVRSALKAVENANKNLSIAPELAGADLRHALGAIKELAGESDIEAVLDRVFSQFCIGK